MFSLLLQDWPRLSFLCSYFGNYLEFFMNCNLQDLTKFIQNIRFGLSGSSVEKIDFQEKNYNTPVIRMLCLGVILALQALMMWNFVLFQFKKMRENKSSKTVKITITKKSKNKSS